jgi:hypothetical protein
MNSQELRALQESYMEVVENQQLDEVSDRKVRAVRDAREKQWNKQFGKNRVQDPTDDMVDRVDKLIDQRNKRTGSKVKKTTMGQLRDKYRKERLGEQTDLYDIILSHLLDEGYADTEQAAEAIMVNMSEDWRESIVEEVLDEGEKPFPYEKVKEKQVALRDKGSAGLDRRMKMGMAVRRAKEAGKKGGSQQDAGKDWYHGK